MESYLHGINTSGLSVQENKYMSIKKIMVALKYAWLSGQVL